MENKKTSKKILIVLFVVLSICFTFGVGYLVGTATGVLSGGEPTDVSTLQDVQNILKSGFYYGEDTEKYTTKLIDDAIRGMVDAQNDPHTVYMSEEELQEFTSSLQASFVGIGVTYTELEKNILIVDVIKFSPAEAAGVQAGDIIVAVDGNKCADHELDDIVAMIKGEVGSEVVIGILRDNKPMDITIIRDEIANTVYSEIKGKVGILTITSFSDGTGDEVKQHLDYLKGKGAKSLIIDLRDNTGGYVTTLDEISGFFMDKGDVIMREYDRDGNEIVDVVKGGTKYKYENIAILVNGYSASCSEVFAMAMKENCSAIIVGDTTYGKGVAQVTQPLSNGGAIKYTDLIWKSGNGVFIGSVGIEPDYPVRLPEALYLSYLVFQEDESYSYDTVNEKIANSQIMLDFLGYDVDRKDGYFDTSTLNAITKFQSDEGITVSGQLDYETANSLNSTVVVTWTDHKDLYDSQMNKALELVK